MMDIIGFFSGVGGIEEGFAKAGFSPIWANEIDHTVAKVFNANHKCKIVVDDIKNIKLEDIPNSIGIVAGFPCQAFSIAGYQKGFEDDRGQLFFNLATIIKEKKPQFIFIENVKNLVRHDKGRTYKIIVDSLENAGYYIKTDVLNACEYANVPQNRERTYIVGFLKKECRDTFHFPTPIPLTKTIKDIVDFKNPVEEKFYYTREKTKFYAELEHAMKKDDTVYQWRRVYVRENKANLCPTLTANMGTGGHNVPLVLTKYGIRKLTPKECFAFQGFDKSLKLPEEIRQTSLYKMAGNSVVVPLIERIAKNIIESLRNNLN
ncbi:MAG: DNA cytosine methyltransferase [Treponema sp.]